MKCRSCGKEIRDGSLYCIFCGERQEAIPAGRDGEIPDYSRTIVGGETADFGPYESADSRGSGYGAANRCDVQYGIAGSPDMQYGGADRRGRTYGNGERGGEWNRTERYGDAYGSGGDCGFAGYGNARNPYEEERIYGGNGRGSRKKSHGFAFVVLTAVCVFLLMTAATAFIFPRLDPEKIPILREFAVLWAENGTSGNSGPEEMGAGASSAPGTPETGGESLSSSAGAAEASVTEAPAYSAAPTFTPVPTETVKMFRLECGAEAPYTDFNYPYLSERAVTDSDMSAWLVYDSEQRKYVSQMAEDEIFVRYGYHYSPDSQTKASVDTYNKYIGREWYQRARAYNTESGSGEGSALMTHMTQIERDNILAINDWQNRNCP